MFQWGSGWGIFPARWDSPRGRKGGELYREWLEEKRSPAKERCMSHLLHMKNKSPKRGGVARRSGPIRLAPNQGGGIQRWVSRKSVVSRVTKWGLKAWELMEEKSIKCSGKGGRGREKKTRWRRKME